IKRSIFAWVIFCFWSVFAAYVGVILAITTIKIDDEILEMLAVGGIVLGMIALILPVLYRVYPREISKLKQTREQYLLQAEINSAKLWQGIREVYPVLPSVEQLRQEYEQLRQTVDLTLRKYSPPGEEHAEA
ncbi:MAG: DUF4190 domain-containing protein, partial [Anaerolineaceae bacterium]|nr:DUF4190 domain-containing protein [Anaerolineaceae bacterium]